MTCSDSVLCNSLNESRSPLLRVLLGNALAVRRVCSTAVIVFDDPAVAAVSGAVAEAVAVAVAVEVAVALAGVEGGVAHSLGAKECAELDAEM